MSGGVTQESSRRHLKISTIQSSKLTQFRSQSLEIRQESRNAGIWTMLGSMQAYSAADSWCCVVCLHLTSSFENVISDIRAAEAPKHFSFWFQIGHRVLFVGIEYLPIYTWLTCGISTGPNFVGLIEGPKLCTEVDNKIDNIMGRMKLISEPEQ
jgi:hypothetical protein